jgi:hypothetical protein
MKNLNYHFKVVFSPKEPQMYQDRKRFYISINRLSFYVGQNNSLAVITALKVCTTDKSTMRFRKYGKLEIYSK